MASLASHRTGVSGLNRPQRVHAPAVIARAGGKKTATTTKQAPAKGEESFMSQTLNAFDFAQTRSQKDADLLWEAKYGKRGADGKMTPEQYAALRRKVGGTAKDYWKDWIEEDVVDKTWYKPGSGTAVPYLPLLVGVVLAMLVTTVFVISKTS